MKTKKQEQNNILKSKEKPNQENLNISTNENNNTINQNEHEALIKLLRLINAKNSLYEFMQALSRYFKELTGCEAIGIRLKEGNDYPYYVAQGFPEEFIQLENSLCITDLNGQLMRDEIGNPILECMCGNILSGRFDPEKPFFTENGSFWTNCTTDLLASTTEADRQSRTRNRCNGEGYESVALIPLKFGDDVFGLVQINDKRKNRFNKQLISMIERLSNNIAAGLAQRRSLEKLEESENRFKTIVETAEAGYFFIDSGGFFREVNDAWLKLYHYDSKDEIIGKKFSTTYDKVDIKKANEFFSGMLRGDKKYLKGELARKLKDGTIGYHTLSAKPVFKLGKVIGIEGFIIDSTERKLAEIDLKKAEEKFKIFADYTYDWEFWHSPTGEFLYNSPSCKKITGYDPLEFISTPGLMDEIIHPDDKHIWKDHRHESSVGKSSSKIEFRIINTNGNIYWIEHCCNPVYSEEGVFLGTRGSNRDISERKQSENALIASEVRYRRLFESAKDGILILNADTGLVVGVNPFLIELLGYSQEQFREKYIWDFGFLKDTISNKEKFLELRKKEYVRYEDLGLETFDGKKINVEFVSNVYLVNDLKVIQCNIRDITQRKQSERFQKLFSEILAILNEPDNFQDVINKILSAIKKETGFDAVGIRLKKDNDYPYFVQNGFSSDFLITENSLAVHSSQNGGICKDENGNYSLECTCGLVISGKAGSSNPFFTKEGSFWTNNSLPLLELPAGEDPRLHPRNRCIHEGFLSVALIPIRTNQEIIGILQLNSRKKNCFTLEMIQFFEGISASIGIAMKRKQAEESLRDSEKRYHNLYLYSDIGIFHSTIEGRFIDMNPALAKMLGYDFPEEAVADIKNISEQIYVDPPKRNAITSEQLKTGKQISAENQYRRRDGSIWYGRFHARIIKDLQGQPSYFEGFIEDITERKRMEDALRESDKKLNQAQELAHIGVWDWKSETDKVVWTKELYNIAGLDPVLPAPTYAEHSALYSPESWKALKGAVDRALETGESYQLELELIRPDKSIRYVYAFGGVKRDAYGRISGLFGTVQDITERIMMEKSLRESEEKFRNLFNNSEVGMFRTRLDGSEVLDFNDKYLSILGRTREETVGKLSEILWADPKEREEMVKTLEQKGHVDELECRLIRKGGKVITCIMSMKLYSEQGILEGTVIDITERKQMEETLKKSEELHRLLAEKSNALICEINIEGKFLYVNPAFKNILGYEPEELLGKTPFDIADPADKEKGDISLLKAGSINDSQQNIWKFYDKNKNPHYLNCFSNTYKNPDGQIRINTIAFDITEQKRMEEALLESESRFRAMFESSRDAIGVSKKGIHIYANPAYLKLFGYENNEQIIGTSILNSISPASQKQILQNIQNRAYGEPIPTFYEARGMKLDGTEFDSEVNVSTYELKGEIYSLANIRDITERKKMEKALQESEIRHREMIANISDIIVIMSPDGILKYISPNIENWFGWKPDDLINTDGWATVHTNDLKSMQKEFFDLLENDGMVKTVEFKFKCKNGSFKPIELTAKNLINDPVIKGVLMNYHDITDRKLAIEAIKSSEERFRLLFQNLSNGFALHEIILDKKGKPCDYRFLEVNPAFEQMTGLKASEIAGKTAVEVLPGIENYWIDTYGKVALTGVPVHFENFSKDLNKYYEVSAYSPKKGQFAVITADITERKQMEKSLQESEEKFRRIFEDHSAAKLLIDPDSGDIIDANKSAVVYYGWTREELKQMKIYQINSLTPEEVKNQMEKATSHKRIRFEFKHQLKDGSIRDVEVFSSKIKIGKKDMLHSIVHDITDRKIAEESLKLSEDRFRKLVQSVTDYIYTVKVENGEPVSTVHGPACISVTGYSSEEFAKDPYLWYNIIHKDDQYKVVKELNNILTGELVKHFEHRIIHKAETVRWVKNTVVVLRNEKGEVTEYDGLIVDITEKKLAEEEILKLNIELEARVQERTAELASANKELEAFSYSVSHDLKAPLRAVSGFSELALKEFKKNTGNNILGFLEKINFASLKMASLIDDLLNLSRISQAAVNKTTFNICSVSRTTMDDLRSQNPQRKVKYIQPEEIMVNADLNLVRIALFNLLGNAWKYTSKKTKANIEFGVKKTDDNIIFFVKDNGDGFDMKYSDKLFSPFQRLHASNEFEGTGIGLSIVKRIISKHNGRIWAESKKGIGTIIYFTLGKD